MVILKDTRTEGKDFTPIRMTAIKKTDKTRLGKGMEKSGYLYMAGGHIT